MKRRLLSTPRTLCALLLAAAAACLAFVATTPAGDPQAAVTQVERAIADVDGVIARHSFQLRDASAPRPEGPSRTLYRMAGASGELVFLEGPAGRDRGEVERIFAALYAGGQARYVSGNSALSEIRSLASRLVPENQKIAEAKAMCQFDAKPRVVSDAEWRERLPDSVKPWQIQESGAFQRERLIHAIAAGAGVFTLFVLALAIVSLIGQGGRRTPARA